MGGKKVKKQKDYYELHAAKEMESWEDHLFTNTIDMGGIEEVNKVVARYREKTEVTDEEVETLKKNAPPSPDFPVLTKDEYDGKFICTRSSYRTKVKDYYRRRSQFFTAKAEKNMASGSVYLDELRDIERRESVQSLVQENEQRIEEAKKKGYYRDFDEFGEDDDAICDAMDEEFEKLEDNQDFIETEEEIAKKENEIRDGRTAPSFRAMRL